MTSLVEHFPTQALFLPEYFDPTVFTQISDAGECTGFCQDTDCVAFIFNNRSQQCLLYRKSMSYSYKQVLVEDIDDQAFIAVCTSGRSLSNALHTFRLVV